MSMHQHSSHSHVITHPSTTSHFNSPQQQMFRALVVFVVLAMAAAFAPARMLARTNMAINGEEMAKSSFTGSITFFG